MYKVENDVEDMLVKACKRLGIRCPKGKSKNNKGYPDRIVYHRIRHEIYHVEVKNQTYWEQQVLQKEWQVHIEESGGKYFLIDGVEEMKQFIERWIE